MNNPKRSFVALIVAVSGVIPPLARSQEGKACGNCVRPRFERSLSVESNLA